VKVTPVHWTASWRLVPSRFPPIGLFDRVTKKEDLEAIFAIESMTNDRLRDEVGELQLVPEHERQSGPGTTPIMAAFTHMNPDGSRFSDGSYGVYYAANDIDTALAETRYHRERFLKHTNEAPIEVDMRSYKSEIKAELHDIRGEQSVLPEVYADDDYSASQKLARELREQGSNGIVYDSVRHAGGECVAIFRANIPMPTTQGSHYCFCWNGKRIFDTYRKEAV
jgi:hypothetical protein